MNLDKPAPAAARRLAGRILIGAMLCTSAIGTVLARADTAAGPAAIGTGVTYEVALELKHKTTIDAPGVIVVAPGQSPRVLVREGELFSVRSEAPDETVEGEFRLSDAGPGKVAIRIKLKNNNKVVGEPMMIARLGETSTVAIGDKDGKQSYKVSLTVNLAKKPIPGA